MIASMDGRNNVDANNSAPNIDDVLDVLKRDELVSQGLMERSHHMVGSILSAAPPNAYIKILEQPAPKALRFRYECEGRSAGSIPGISSTPENKTYPTIQLVGFKGRAVVVVSCVTKDAPHKAHPHNLVGKESCKKGVCTMEVSNDNMMASFANLGIQCVKKKDIEEALRAREKIRVDPYRQGFSHRNQPGSIDLNSVRLCFQAYLEGPERGQFTIPLSPVVSEPIYDKKAMADLVICRLSQCSGSAGGGTDVILLCEKVAKEDINVRFYEEKNGVVVWEALGDFTPTQVHKQVAISFKTPRYKTLQIEEPVKVWIELRRPSDGATSEPRPFTLYPVESDWADNLQRKRRRPNPLFQEVTPPQETDLLRRQEPNSFPGITVKREPIEGGICVSPNFYAGGVVLAGNTNNLSPLNNLASRSPSPNYPLGSYSPAYILPSNIPPSFLSSVTLSPSIHPISITAIPSSSCTVPQSIPQNIPANSFVDLDTQNISIEINTEELRKLEIGESGNLNMSDSLNGIIADICR